MVPNVVPLVKQTVVLDVIRILESAMTVIQAGMVMTVVLCAAVPVRAIHADRAMDTVTVARYYLRRFFIDACNVGLVVFCWTLEYVGILSLLDLLAG